MRLCNLRLKSRDLEFIGIRLGKSICFLHEVLEFAVPFATEHDARDPDSAAYIRFSRMLDAQHLTMIDLWKDEFLHSSDNPDHFTRLDREEFDILPPVQPVESIRLFTTPSTNAAGTQHELPFFSFGNTSSIIGQDEELVAPTFGKQLDCGLAIAAVIGVECSDVPADEAESVIAGYTIVNQWCLRDVERVEREAGAGPGKSRDFATSLGPFLVTPDELESRRSGKGYDIEMALRINGTEVSRCNWRDAQWSFGDLISWASLGLTLYPGEIIVSSMVGKASIQQLTPEYVAGKLGRDSGWLQPGDIVELRVPGLGKLRNKIV